ncbi:hypothetical protein S7711_06659 [Stachybotrys chartarum IBT 7711]|uniref:Xylanolytic transcriptional activator regulatory domain-containing protein n=1 Tax=Stachybotrys chartarum (strain CBS 109288 / IBT 7711) TaxID=1280523 RepID=A0A084BB28_STACB|nr:hypothetical protein S7711_06659 [Stachybotrys chartarum IBT 7711]
MKCDRQLPSCSQCVTAKSTCTGISANAATDVPRSIVQHLESEIALLETALVQDGRLDMDVVQASDILLQMPSTLAQTQLLQDQPNDGAWPEVQQPRSRSLRARILSGKPLQDVVSATLPHGSDATYLLSRVRMGMTPSTAQVGDRGRSAAATAMSNNTSSAANKGSSKNILLNANVLGSIPPDIVQRLMRKYLNTIQQDSPFLVASMVVQQFENVKQVIEWQASQVHGEQHQQPRAMGEEHSREQQVQAQPSSNPPVMHCLQVLPSHDFLVVYLILAISVTLGSANNKTHEEHCMSLSMSLFEEGIQHFSSLSSFPSDIAWLQVILLLLLYATIFPRSANVWVLSGSAMRACLELGLHRELPDDEICSSANSEICDLRRRVFWAAYCMDRSICSALQRPLSTPDAAINTRLPILNGDNETMLGSITYYRLLSEMLHVHFQREKTPNHLSWDEWLADMESRLRAWYRRHGHTTSGGGGSASHDHEMTAFDMARGLMILHRPSPCVPYPEPNSLLVAFEAAATAARINKEHIRAGFFRRPWLSAHHTIEAATVVLFCLRHGAAAIMQRFTATQVFEMTKLFTGNLLLIAGQGWPEVSVYASVYERLLGPLLERFFLGRQDLSEAFGPAQDAELMRLLYPGPAQLEKLRFGWRQPQQEEDTGHPFDFYLSSLEDDDLWGGIGLGFPGGEGREDGQRWEWMDVHGIDLDFRVPG